MKELLIKLLSSFQTNTLTPTQVFELSNVLRNYHRAAAKAQWIDTVRAGWFMSLADKFSQVERQRWAVDVLVKLTEAGVDVNDASVVIDSLYTDALNALLLKLS